MQRNHLWRSVMAASALAALLQTPLAHAADAPTAPTPTAANADWADGEVRKIDLAQSKITLKHGEIKNLDMPGMTMVFVAQDAVLLSRVKVGDKVRFTANKAGGAIVVTDIQPTP